MCVIMMMMMIIIIMSTMKEPLSLVIKDNKRPDGTSLLP